MNGLVEPKLEVEIEPRANSRAICSGCGTISWGVVEGFNGKAK